MSNGLGNIRTISLGLGVAVLALLAAAPLRAERTRYWRQSNYEEFEKGTPKGVAFRSDGKLVLAPRFVDFADANAAYLWALRLDSKGNLYAAGGSDAKVLRFDAQGRATTIFESEEMAAQALAIDALDNVYVATSPDGKVYKVTPAGEKTVFFDPKRKYIWDLAVDTDGTVYVATGDKGEIFSVTREGKGQVFYNSEETHIRSLAFDPKGNLLAGTEPNGLILRIPKAASESARQPFVLYETSKQEITALLVDRVGNTYAAAIGEKARPAPMPQPVPTIVPTQPPTGAPTEQAALTAAAAQAAARLAQQAQATAFVPFPPMAGSAVYRIAPDGSPEELWSSRQELVYGMGFAPSGKLLLGTGNRGIVIQLEEDNIFSNLAKTAASQVTSLVQGPGGRVYLCTANPGKIFTLGPDDEPEGTFQSQPFDAKIFSQWGRLNWWGENNGYSGSPKPAANAPVVFYVRSGNTSNPEKNWSPWSGPYATEKGEKVDAPPARFVQWKAVFRAPAKGQAPPSISWVSLSYLPKNVAPTIDAIVMQNPGIRAQGFQGPSQAATAPQPVQLRLPPPPPGQPGAFPTQPSGEKPPQRFESPPQGFSQKGYQAVLWSARDENDDELVYSIYYRGEGEKTWKLLKDKIEQKFYSWDTTTMPDGAYYLKIVASDAPSNPPQDALAAERESERFEVDNTPPVIQNLRAQVLSPEVRVLFEARDPYSAIARCEYSLDAGDWTLIFPVGQLTDAPQETYEMVLKGLSPGEHTLAVRAFDQFENGTTAKVTFTLTSR